MELSPITIFTDQLSIWIFWDFCFFSYSKIFPFCHMWYSSVCPLLIKCLPCGLYLKEKPDATVRNLASLCLRYPLSTYSACIIQAIGGLHFGGLYHLAGGIPGGTSDKKKSTCQHGRCGFNPWAGKIT